MLNVVHICGDSLNNIFAILEPLDGGLGDSTGLAHWDGRKWSWLQRFEGAYANLDEMKYRRKRVYILNSEGSVCTIPSIGWHDKLKTPAVRELSGGKFVEWTRFRSFDLIADNQIGIVGDKGAFFIRESETWRYVETNCQASLNCIYGAIPNCYICGEDGVVLRYDGVTCHMLHRYEGDFLVHIDRAEDNIHFMSFGRRDQNGGLLKVIGGKVQRIPTTLNLGRIAVFSSREIYCTDWRGLFCWNGDSFKRVLSNIFGAVAKVNGTILFGTGPRPEGGDAIYFGPPFGPKISIDLDPAYIVPEERLECRS